MTQVVLVNGQPVFHPRGSRCHTCLSDSLGPLLNSDGQPWASCVGCGEAYVVRPVGFSSNQGYIVPDLVNPLLASRIRNLAFRNFASEMSVEG